MIGAELTRDNGIFLLSNAISTTNALCSRRTFFSSLSGGPPPVPEGAGGGFQVWTLLELLTSIPARPVIAAIDWASWLLYPPPIFVTLNVCISQVPGVLRDVHGPCHGGEVRAQFLLHLCPQVRSVVQASVPAVPRDVA